jgi:hypothetical protein
MKKWSFYFECTQKFGRITAEADDGTEQGARAEARKRLQHGTWCAGKCDTCKLKLKKIK